MTIQEQTNNLYKEQAKNWPLLSGNLEGLKSAQLKTFDFDGFQIKVQFNPKRITSSAAKVDKKSIEERKCFLCSAHRPEAQNEVPFNTYEILCNPFPIFREHYTIAHLDHIPQEIGKSFTDFLDISKALPDLLCFYNAPNCGASAPDHLHFQAGNKGFVPIESDYEGIIEKYGQAIVNNHIMNIQSVNDGLRTFIAIESNYKEGIISAFSKIFKLLNNGGKTEPMLNILSWYNSGWRVLIMLRGKHRPWQFFEEGEKNILLSPASVDMGGTLITPLEKDFNKITKDDVYDIMRQVSYSKDEFDVFTQKLIQQLK